ncbi:hypothetical protein QN277_000927 [Acacia crassicarpa]|uniref:Uncharacterized protein n=1 Tax=Acacia crassicarpa TaxID=499986 RepID=A0AAE1TGH9_9FABA|nr:hypothetical protein QN277_000927 [Acacia crassicarpa]
MLSAICAPQPSTFEVFTLQDLVIHCLWDFAPLKLSILFKLSILPVKERFFSFKISPNVDSVIDSLCFLLSDHCGDRVLFFNLLSHQRFASDSVSLTGKS